MSASWDRTLFLPNLPKKLTSRRNLHAYFSKFGDIDVSVDKDNRSGVVQFPSHSEAKAAKALAKIYDGKPLQIVWNKNKSGNTLDPRAKEQEDIAEIDGLWQDDDKECFGVETKSAVEEVKKSAKDMINQHLKLPGVRRRLGSVIKASTGNKSESSESKMSPFRLNKLQPKPGASLKKTVLNKRKLLRKEGITSDENKKKVVVRELTLQTGPVSDRIDLKQKLALLDERDKLIRQETVQDSNIKTAVAIKGTCPDMCPERERILRQCGHAVAIYEMLPGTNEMDENRAVKEYIRSSADQEVPLPHDLRPEPVLSMTMNYLITNIINKIDDPNENKAIWYSFCWNRLRSIRKDIILQQLCDLETVAIVEQCARFHISCYDHMWGAEVSGFDDKINTNNLIDCLQTLKHLYEDLANRNIKCPNEPEFYAYLILLKLTTGDVIWEYQQYAPEIQLSPRVQFAITVYMAFENNMYSKYFSLVKQASYLEACLLQRHFDKVRRKALTVMLKAYSLPNRNVGLTTSFLMNCLKFDSQKNVLVFCEKLEGYLDKKIEFDGDDNEDDCISTSSFLIREKRLPIANAVVGENNALPIYVPHQVHSSFDEDGKLRESLCFISSENYDSCDSPSGKSDVSTPEVKPQTLTQKKPLKFSLSPNVSKENVFSKNIFSRLGPLNSEQGGLTSAKSPEDRSTKIKSLTSQLGSNDTLDVNESFYDDNNSESFKMEEDIDEEMVYDEGYEEDVKKNGCEKSQLFTLPGEIAHSRFQDSSTPVQILNMPIAPANIKSYFLQGEESHSLNLFSKVTSPKNKSEENLKYPLTTPKDDSAQHVLTKNIMSENLPVGRTEVLFPKVYTHIANQTNETNHLLPPQNEIKSKVDIEVQPLQAEHAFWIDVGKTKENHEREALEKVKKEMSEKLLLEKAEEVRIKMEVAERAELERQKKKIEEQKALESLKKDLCQRMKAKNAKKYARIWKNRVETLKKKRADFPMLYELSVECHLKLWGRIKYIPATSVYQRARDKQTLNVIVSQLLKNGVADSCRYVGRDLAELLAKSAARTMNLGRIQPIYWKLAMSLPWIDISTSEFSVFNQMMRRCCKKTFYKNPNAQLGSVESAMTSLQIPVHVSVHFSDDLESCSGLHGMDALIFVVVEGLESEKTCLDRLRSLVTSQARSSDFSISIMIINGDKFDRILKMELKELHEQNLIAYWTISAWASFDSLFENLCFLAEHVSVVQDVCARPLESLVREAFDDFIYGVDKSQAYCPALIDALENPNIVIHVYNTFLTKLEDLLLSSKLEKYFNFAEEFKSHIPPNECGGPELMCGRQYNQQYKTQVSNKINSLKLPQLSGWPAHSNQINFETLSDLVEMYCRTQIDDMEVYKQVIRKLAQEEVADSSSYVSCYSWLHIVEMWAESRFRHVFSSREKSRKTFVIYNKNDVQRMIKNQWWITHPIVAQASNKL